MNTKEHEDLIVDRFGRRFRNLRVSLTAACNYACTYCVPDGKKLQAASYELSSDEMIRAVSLLVECAGIEQIRITGGEPLLSPKFDHAAVVHPLTRSPFDNASLMPHVRTL